MLNDIMVPLDGSRFAEQVLPLALTLARRAHARLHLVLVRPSVPLDFQGAGPDEYLERVHGQIESELPGAITHTVLTPSIDTPAYLPPPANGPADRLARHAAERQADVIVMTTHGRGGLRRAWLGSVADSVTRLSIVPVLLMKPDDEEFTLAADADRGLQHIILPLDGSPRAEFAIPIALELGAPFAARYTLLRVVTTMTYTPHHDALADYVPELVSPVSGEELREYLEKVAAPLRERGYSIMTQIVQHASAASGIVHFAQEHDASLIAMSTSGRGGMRRLLLGSVADKVVRSADRPVLVVNVHARDDPHAHEATLDAHANG